MLCTPQLRSLRLRNVLENAMNCQWLARVQRLSLPGRQLERAWRIIACIVHHCISHSYPRNSSTCPPGVSYRIHSASKVPEHVLAAFFLRADYCITTTQAESVHHKVPANIFGWIASASEVEFWPSHTSVAQGAWPGPVTSFGKCISKTSNCV